jgi:predicted TPR repeat methyltransferase
VKIADTEWKRAARAAAGCFLPDRNLYYYARCKMLWDPAYEFLAKQLLGSRRPLTDLGCGPGVFAAWLRELGADFEYKGFDLSTAKVSTAQHCVATKWPDTEFVACDAAVIAETGSLPGDIVALDLLHYFSSHDQKLLLQNLAGCLPAGCRLFLRNGVRDTPAWRHLATSVEEAFVRSSSWIRGGEWNFPTRAFVETTLRNSGLSVVAVPMWGRTPFSSYLFVASRR